MTIIDLHTIVSRVGAMNGARANDISHLIRYYLRIQFPNMTLHNIGEVTGGVTHATVLSSIAQAEIPAFKKMRIEIEKEIMNANLPTQTLADKVREMREAQRQYFATRSSDNLAKAKRLEAEVDKLLANSNQSTIPFVR
jgi:uncharacterized protein YqfA (UPF0365 family)